MAKLFADRHPLGIGLGKGIFQNSIYSVSTALFLRELIPAAFELDGVTPGAPVLAWEYLIASRSPGSDTSHQRDDCGPVFSGIVVEHESFPSNAVIRDMIWASARRASVAVQMHTPSAEPIV
jgi:hypothetical protein